MTDRRFVGLVHSLLSSAEASLGEDNSPLTARMTKDGVLARRTAERSLELLDMLYDKTSGNLNETERDALVRARSGLRKRLEAESDAPRR